MPKPSELPLGITTAALLNSRNGRFQAALALQVGQHFLVAQGLQGGGLRPGGAQILHLVHQAVPHHFLHSGVDGGVQGRSFPVQHDKAKRLVGGLALGFLGGVVGRKTPTRGFEVGQGPGHPLYIVGVKLGGGVRVYGGEALVHLRVEMIELVARVEAHAVPRPGERVQVAIDRERLHWFAEDGSRVEEAAAARAGGAAQ